MSDLPENKNPYYFIDRSLEDMRIFLRREIKDLAIAVILDNPGFTGFQLDAKGCSFLGKDADRAFDSYVGSRILRILEQYDTPLGLSKQPMRLRLFPSGFVKEIVPLRVIDK